MKVGFIIDYFFPQRGGAERTLADLSLFLSREGIHPHIYCARGEGGDLPITLHFVPRARGLRVLKEWSFARRSLAMAKTDGVDVTVGIRHTPGVDLYHPHGGVYLVAYRQNLLAVQSPALRSLKAACRFFSLRQWFFIHQEKRICSEKPLPLVAAVSRSVGEDVVRNFPACEKEIRIVYNGVNTERFAPSNRETFRGPLRARLEIPESAFVLLFIAHNFRLKGLIHLVQSVEDARKKVTAPLVLLVAGRGRRKPYEKIARRLGIEQAVRFLGEVQDVEQYYGASDAFVLPTYYDPCSLVVLEALASGVPVITTRFNGAADLITHGKEGFVLERPSDVETLSERICSLADVEKRAKMGKAAAALGQKFSLEKNFNEFHRLLQEAKARKSP